VSLRYVPNPNNQIKLSLLNQFVLRLLLIFVMRLLFPHYIQHGDINIASDIDRGLNNLIAI